jgi:hypothetical protein
MKVKNCYKKISGLERYWFSRYGALYDLGMPGQLLGKLDFRQFGIW